jgi:hypothetical protein
MLSVERTTFQGPAVVQFVEAQRRMDGALDAVYEESHTAIESEQSLAE